MITVYATNKDGKGFVQVVGEYNNWDEIKIRTGMYASDVVITFEEKK